MRRVFDRHGRCWQRVTCFRPVAPAEYDAHCAADAEADAAAGRSPSLRWSLGDRRTGEQLLGQMVADRRVTLTRLRGSRRGRAWLSRLAAEVRQRFGQRMRAAAAAGMERGSARDSGAGMEEEVAARVQGIVEDPWPPPPPPPQGGYCHATGSSGSGGGGGDDQSEEGSSASGGSSAPVGGCAPVGGSAIGGSAPRDISTIDGIPGSGGTPAFYPPAKYQPSAHDSDAWPGLENLAEALEEACGGGGSIGGPRGQLAAAAPAAGAAGRDAGSDASGPP